MNELMIKLIHEKLDKELKKIPHEYGYQDVKLELIITVCENLNEGKTECFVKMKGLRP